MSKSVIQNILIVLALLIGGFLLFGSKSTPSEIAVNNVTQNGENQTITVHAKGGYSPKVTSAKAETPAILQMVTEGTYDCSSSLTIPSLGIRTNLSPTGITEVEIPPQDPGTTIEGLCSMGMYRFVINFN